MLLPAFRVQFGVAALALLAPILSLAMDLPHYDLDSLTYMSTDIVIATISKTAENKFVAQVTRTLHGNLQPGLKLDKLSEFLAFFRPIEDNAKLILFLDSRPHGSYFFAKEASESPYAIVTSGIYLIDSYGRVHEFYQHDNPGPYIAEGYTFFPPPAHVPTQADDLKLASLESVENRIQASLDAVLPVRELLGKTVTRKDIPALTNLLAVRQESVCGSDAIKERALAQIREPNDWELLLRVSPFDSTGASELSFVNQPSGEYHKEFAVEGVHYLIKELGDRHADLSMRMAAANTLQKLGRWSGDFWLATSRTELQEVAAKVFHNNAEDGELRGLCVELLPLDRPGILAGLRRVYTQAKSPELKFAIEGVALGIGDAVYESLNPPGGPVSSRVTYNIPSGCASELKKRLTFVVNFRKESKFVHGSFDELVGQQHNFVLTNNLTGKRAILDGGMRWVGEYDGEFSIDINEETLLDPGKYRLAYEFSRDGKVVSSGYPLSLHVVKTNTGNKLLLN